MGTYGYDGNYTNDWTQASLMKILNDTYYNSKNDNTYCREAGVSNTSNLCDFISGSVRGLGDDARNMIDKEISWPLGGIDSEYKNVEKILLTDSFE